MNKPQQNKDGKYKRKSGMDMSTMVYGKVPPQAKDLEAAVLGAIMLETRAFGTAISLLVPESFYVEAHQRIFKAMQSLNQKSQPIDILTMVEELKFQESLDIVGGPYYVTKLTNAVTSSANIKAHCQIVHQKFMQRELIRIGGEMISEAYEDSTDVFDLIDISESKISNLSISKTAKPYESLQVVADRALQKISEIQQSGEMLTGVPTGISRLDIITQGWQPTNLIVLAARPGVGKSALAANFALNAAKHKTKPTPVGIFTLEMPNLQWVMRMLAAESYISMGDLKRGRVNQNEMDRLSDIVYKQMAGMNIFFDDSSSLDIYQLKTKARQMVMKEKVGLLIIDYLQLMGGSRQNGESRENEVSKISRELKQLAKELNIPVIALSQLNRKGEGDSPSLGNLRESGAIEQDADDVFFLVGISDEEAAEDASLQDSILIKIAKHRNGTLENIPVKFVKSIQKIMNEFEYSDYHSGKTTGNWKPVQIFQAGLTGETNDPPPF